MNHTPADWTAPLQLRLALAAALFCVATAAAAQAVPQAQETQKTEAKQAAVQEAEAEEYESPPPLLMGDATLNLLAWQRSGEIASRTPRPIAGSVAGRSYERYIKSFEHPIPEHLGSTVAKSKGGGGSSSGDR
ncbi:DUF3613 domain-containing protein [Variovorax paradoxus]|jgi:hypothetical protein|uniref:DUF3613 domain-containing protein n=1 Tax=Variovorax paradoxus TaxID=34073 RepID=UPI00248030D1|nr:DUF3613 domain-containing protein [Variovorax paradoxus]WGT63261.1 DUF3613 domain-containing protein [Variovorax paradoxus]